MLGVPCREDPGLPAVLRTEPPVFVNNKGGEHCEVSVRSRTTNHTTAYHHLKQKISQMNLVVDLMPLQK